MEQGKISIGELSQMFADKRGLDTARAEAFVQAMFNVVIEALQRDSLVKVKGIGTFKLIKVEARRSVNISTGEPFTIAEHTKVTFTPDATLRDLVNRPFAEFETVVLSDAVDIEQLNSIEVEAPAEEADEPVEDEAPATVEVLDNVENIDNLDTLDNVDNIDNVAIVDPVKEPVESIDNTVNTSEPIQHINQQHVNEQHITHQTIEHSTHTTNMQNQRKLSLWEAMVLMLFVVALSGASYLAGYNHWFLNDDTTQTSESITDTPAAAIEQPAETIVTDSLTNAPDSMATDNDTIQAEAPVAVTPLPPTEPPATTRHTEPPAQTQDTATLAAQYPQAGNGAYLIIGIKDEYEIRPGDQLYDIARRYYGSKDFARYIILLNNISNPDIVKVGTLLKIPQLVRR